jgi:microcystin-dependent protein
MANFTQLTSSMAIVAALATLPNQTDGLTDAQLKAKFDEAAGLIKTYLNSTLISELEASGAAAKLGASVGGSSSNIQAFIDAVEAAGTGSLPPSDTVTNVMLNSTIKTGLLADYNGTVKTSVIAICNEILAKFTDTRHIFPAGIISMWSGTIATIPAGFALCDGTNGTPNLADKFIMGTTSQGSMNATGGSNTKALTTNELPSHTHTGTTDSGGAHAHTTSIIGTGGSGPYYLAGGGTSTTTISQTSSTAATHTHGFTTSSTGSGATFDNRPAYYVLAYVMKL